MPSKLAIASPADNLRFNLFHVVPYLLRGAFTRNPRWVRWLGKLQRDPSSVRFLGHLRDKYRCGLLAVRMLTDRTLLLFDPEAIRHVLDHSPEIYAETKGKRRGMSHFQPHALTISRGAEWQDRRRFNTAVLDPAPELHPLASHFLSVIRRETALQQSDANPVDWTGFARLFDAITLQIVFGDGVNDFSLTDSLKQMMLEANNVVLAGRKSKYFDAFYRTIEHHLAAAPDLSLACRCRHTPSTGMTRVPNQIPHWMFAMGDTLAVNTAGALALLCVHPEAQARVRDELGQYPPVSAENIERLTFLEGCIQEAMRLWPSTLMLMREAVVDDYIGDIAIAAGTQILIHNGFNHRDPQTVDAADRFQPEFWLDRPVDYRFNHFSNGAQACAGKKLALFICKALLATLLERHRYTLQQPLFRPNDPVPYAFDHFSVRWERNPVA